MRILDDRVFLSASDLMRFVGCAHATTLDLAFLHGDGPVPGNASDDTELLRKKGDAHEAAYLSRLQEAGRDVVMIDVGKLTDNAETTREALAAGSEVIFQGAFKSDSWGGWADFLERVEKPSELGPFSYEVTDTKLKQRPHPKHVLQLMLYSDLLAEVQGVAPEYAHIELGSGSRETLRLSGYSSYARMTRERLEAFVVKPEPTRPIPCADCRLCRWFSHCETVWREEDSLFNVAGISRDQVKKLEAAGVTTIEALAKRKRRIPGMYENTQERLTRQARLQHGRKTGGPSYELREPETGRGFDLLPKPQTGDLFYDIEGDPHFEGGLEYLHGIWSDGQFSPFWAHDHNAEMQALIDVLAHFRTQITKYPDAHIYHYAPYEVTVLKRLTTKYGTGEAFLDRLLRERRFVDLFAVVRGGLIGSEPNYSIKSMEAFYGRKREGEVTTAGGSVVAYENWRETGDRKLLDEIETYNRIDCVSTEELRNWLVSIRPNGHWPRPAPDAEGLEVSEDSETQAFRQSLIASELPEERQNLLFNLGLFHKREQKPAQWAVFDSAAKDEDELIDDPDALAGLKAVGPVKPLKRSFVRVYSFPPQETKLRAGNNATLRTGSDSPIRVTIESMDRDAHKATVKAGPGKHQLLTDRLSLLPSWPLNTTSIANALREVISDQCQSRTLTAVDDLLSRSPPRLKSGAKTDILGGEDPVAGVIAAIRDMDSTVLPIQGPPGTGKTYVSARAILSLVIEGHRVGVTSNSHEAIRNVLMTCHDLLEEGAVDLNGRAIDIVHKVSGRDDGYPDNFDGVIRVTSYDDNALSFANIVGGTAFMFSRPIAVPGTVVFGEHRSERPTRRRPTEPPFHDPQYEQHYDWLFVDEAGQVSLANLIAMGRTARNIVLVGDPRQLPQVIQGSHPDPANLSCLEWILGDHTTVPPDRGIFLPVTRRMHPRLCGFISDQIYGGRLTSHPDTARQGVSGTILPEAGAYWLPVEHQGNSQTCDEEAKAIGLTIDALLEGNWTDGNGDTRPMSKEDIIVVTPYNAQVNLLRDTLPAAIRIGTVDKFQGQEAPVCLVSMTASSAEETSRGMEFLFSLNRINVAVSRAKALALVFGAPRLREARCETVEQMRLVNTLCALETLPEDRGLERLGLAVS